MIVYLKDKGGWFALTCEEVTVPLGESKFIAISVIDDNEVVVIRRDHGYPNGGECVWSEILSDA